MNSPTVSVVMSVYNGQQFLSEAVESILGQTFRDFEFVVIDDGSADRTAEILAAFAARDRRMRVVRHENKGRTASLNVGISFARGKYIARMDADDIALPHRLKQQVEFMEQQQEAGLLGGAVELMNSRGQVFNTYRPPSEDREIRPLMLDHNAFFHPAVMMRKEVVVASGGYRKPFDESEDYDLFLRMGERSQFGNLDEPVLQYRIHADQVSVRNMRHQTLCTLAARAAASLRGRGSPDPLAEVEEVTPQLLDALEVNALEIHQALLGAYNYWLDVLGQNEPEAALQVVDAILQVCGSGCMERSALANLWLMAAGIHLRMGRPATALMSAGRAVLVRPIVAGRPFKRAFTRLAAALRG